MPIFLTKIRMSLYRSRSHGSVANETKVARNRSARFNVTTVAQQLFYVTPRVTFSLKQLHLLMISRFPVLGNRFHATGFLYVCDPPKDFSCKGFMSDTATCLASVLHSQHVTQYHVYENSANSHSLKSGVFKLSFASFGLGAAKNNYSHYFLPVLPVARSSVHFQRQPFCQ